MKKINLERVPEEQLEKERNPNYKYFDAPELRYKDGTPMRKYNSPKLQAIEMENKQTAVEWLEMQYHRKDYTLSSNDFQQAKQMEKKQTEISDEEIEEQSKYWNETTNPDMWTFKLAWKAGAKWYREQLKKK